MTIVHKIPTIDISPYLDTNSNAKVKARVIAEVKSACSYYGFLQVKGHGVPIETQLKLLESCKTLFDLSPEQKDALSLKNNPARRVATQGFRILLSTSNTATGATRE